MPFFPNNNPHLWDPQSQTVDYPRRFHGMVLIQMGGLTARLCDEVLSVSDSGIWYGMGALCPELPMGSETPINFSFSSDTSSSADSSDVSDFGDFLIGCGEGTPPSHTQFSHGAIFEPGN